MPTLDTIRTELKAAVDGADPGVAAADELCRACVDLLGVDGAAVSLIFDGASQGTFGASDAASRRLDEHQFTFGEGPCLEAAATREPVLVPDLRDTDHQRWPVFSESVMADGIQGVFALPIMITSAPIGALDLFRATPGPLHGDQLAGALLAAKLASRSMLDLAVQVSGHLAEEAHRSAGGGAGGAAYDGPLEDIDRIEVYQATGMLVTQLDVGATEALLRLRAHAIATGQTASAVAWAIVGRQLFLGRDGGDRPDRDGTEGSRP